MTEIIDDIINAISKMEFHDLHIHHHVHGIAYSEDPTEPPTVPPVEPPVSDKPDTIVVRVKARHKFFKSTYNNARGKPVMDHSVIGFRAEVNEKYEVEVPPIEADGGSAWYKIWQGENGNTKPRGWYIPKHITAKM